MADYFPKDEASLLLWLNNYQTKIVTYGPALGLTAAEVTELTTACANLITALMDVEAAKANLRNVVSTKDAAKQASQQLLRSKNNKLKTHDDYTDAGGSDLGIKGSAASPDPETVKPQLSAQAFPGYVRLKFSKKGLDGVNIYTRLKGETQWQFLARDTNSPYDDNRSLASPNIPETREYRCVGVLTDTEVGQSSDIVSELFGG